MKPMEETRTERRRLSPVFVLWIIAIGSIVFLEMADRTVTAVWKNLFFIDLLTVLAWILVVALTLWGLLVVARWILRKLFWRVGRRLFLSYVLIGVLPFVLFAVLLVAILAFLAGVGSQASFRAERQATLAHLEALNAEYALQDRRPRLAGVEIYDTADATGQQLPNWLQSTSFSGFVRRDNAALLVSARRYPGDRTVVFVLPMDQRWATRIEQRGGMIVAARLATRKGPGSFEIREGEGNFDDFERGIAWGRVLFFDVTEEGGLIDWQTGRSDPEKRLFTAISNPLDNLIQFYFGGATNSQIMQAIFGVLIGLAVSLLIAYLIASAFAAVLIFSISRAVNRIEKGTHAVERGDFTYRIRMKPRNQLGAMANSFDRMTESIASLLATVSEKERLQSEIEIAATIQRNLLPKEGPRFRGVSFSAHFEPTASIGGDYYDVFNLDKSRLAVAIGDVSGHGLSTGLVMAMVKAAITTLVEEGADETSLFRRLNELVHRSTERRAFMTLAFTIFDLERGIVRHTNAGHLYPYLLRRGELAPLPIESPSLPLGVRPELATHTVEVPLQEGDAVVYLSDGIVEAQDPHGDPFGFDELEALLGRHCDASPGVIRDAILDAIATHSGERPADDDRTIMVIRFDSLLSGMSAAQPAAATASA